MSTDEPTGNPPSNLTSTGGSGGVTPPTIDNPDLNPGDISSFNPQPDIPGMGNPAVGDTDLHPGDARSFTPPGGGDPASAGNPNFRPGSTSSFTPPRGGDP